MKVKKQDLIEIRRSYVASYLSEGFNQNAIAEKLKCHKMVISKDVKAIRSKARLELEEYCTVILPQEMKVQLIGLNNLINKMFSYVHNPDTDPRTVQAATQIIQQAYKDRMELISSGTLAAKLMRNDEQRKEIVVQQHRDELQTDTN